MTLRWRIARIRCRCRARFLAVFAWCLLLLVLVQIAFPDSDVRDTTLEAFHELVSPLLR